MKYLFSILILSIPSFSQSYDLVLLGSFGGSYTLPRHINNNREIVGWGFDSEFNEFGFFWKEGRFSKLKIKDRLANDAFFITPKDEILVSKEQNFYLLKNHEPFLKVNFPEIFTPAGVSELVAGTITDYGSYPIEKHGVIITKSGVILKRVISATFTAINSKSEVVGVFPHPTHGRNTSFILKNDTLIFPSTHAFISEATDINDEGEVLLKIKETENSNYIVKVYKDSRFREINHLGYNHSFPISINNKGIVLIRSQYISGLEGWMIDSHGETLDLSEFVSQQFNLRIDRLTDLNDKGDIVGIFYQDIQGERFFWAGMLRRL